MDFNDGLGRQVYTRHEALWLKAQQDEQDRRRQLEERHQKLLEAEPFHLATRLLIDRARNSTVYKTNEGHKKVYAPLLGKGKRGVDKNWIESRLGLSGDLTFWRVRLRKPEITLSLHLQESPLMTGERIRQTEQILGKVIGFVGANNRPYGFLKFNPPDTYQDPLSHEAEKLHSILREAARIQSIPVMPLELPTEEPPAV